MITSSAQDELYMRLALEEAQCAVSRGEVPIAAVLVYENEVIAKAHNFRESWQDPTAHAELVAIRRAAEKLQVWRLNGTSLYSTLEPCVMCVGAIVHARITRLVFGAEDTKAGACGSVFNIPEEPRLNHRVVVERGVCEHESRVMLQSFFRTCREQQTPKAVSNIPGLI